MLDMISIILNLLRFDLWPKMWSNLENVPCVLEKKVYYFIFGLIEFSRSVVSDSLWPREPQHASAPIHHQLQESTQTHVHQVGDAIQPSHPLSSSSPPAFNLSQHHGLLKWGSSSHQVAQVLSFSFNNSPSNEHPGLISFRMDWLDLLGVQGTLKSLLQHHSSKASIVQCSVFFIVQLSHPYMTTGKTIALIRWTFVVKVMSLLFNTLSRLVMEKAMAPHSSTLAWKIPWMEEPGRLQSMGSLRVGRDWATSLSLFTFMHWRRKWQPTPVFLPGESQGRGSLVGCCLWGCTESNTTEVT